MQENNFFCVSEIHAKTNFLLKLGIFVFKKNIQNMLGCWPYATHKKNIFLDIYIYTHTKKKHKINTQKTNDFTRFLGAGSSLAHVAGLNSSGLVGSLAQTSDPAGHKGMLEFPHACLAWLLFK
jgi:hypothetical protein